MATSPHPSPVDSDIDRVGRVLAFDWSSTPLGPISSWSPTERAALGIIPSKTEPENQWQDEPHRSTPIRLVPPNSDIAERLNKLQAVNLENQNQRRAALNLMTDAVQSRRLAEKSHQDLRVSEERFRAFVTASSDVVYRMSPDWSEMRQLQGDGYLVHTNAPNNSWLAQYIHPRDQGRVLSAIQDAIHRKGIFELEHRVFLADGTLGWTFSRAVPLLDARGEIREWFGTASDITERKQAEEALTESDRRYRQLFDSMDEGFCTAEVLFDEKGHPIDHLILEANPAFEKHTGIKYPVGKKGSELVPGLEQEWNEIYGQVAVSGDSVRLEKASEAQHRWYDIFVSRIGDATSKRVAVIFTDITERIRSQNNLAEKARLIDLSNDAIVVRDLDGKISTWNKGAEKLFGWTSEEVLGKAMDTLLQTEFPKPREEIVAQLYQEKEFTGEVVQVARDGRIVPSLCRWVLDLGTKSILTSYTDITERKVAEVEMAEARNSAELANISKDMFLAALSHELRTPLSPVLLLAEEAMDDPSMSPTAHEIFATIVKNVKLEARLIDDLLDVTRITHGKLALNFEVVDVHAALRDALETVQTEIEEKRIELTLDLTKKSVLINGDPIRLQQIFWNVLRNAVKFSAQGGKITVETRTTGSGFLTVSVADTGLGIAKQELQRLFGAFAQGDHASGGGSHRFGGLGLGLSISRMLTEFHSGTIRAESPGVNQGATFIIELPLNPEQTLTEKPRTLRIPLQVSTAAVTENYLDLCRILLVEDHEPTRTALTHLLARRNYVVVPVGTLAEARVAAEAAKFDLLISDIGLPDGSGLDLMADLHRRFGLTGIALTGYGRDEDVVRSRQVGFKTHLIKPVSIQALETALATAIIAK